ncbi:methionine--tRNA ligase [Metallumcola ferriviriculae]|uniref:Methionine--tRNA ligase n=1 Tax=Metallumcola ferriviriculae TaxID=3039180 RepID=A0AAU0UIT7_9FIRM|nr:methionine--tRNA ligase [Desulfitibacteraceae bacterium MK1]
MSKKSYYITTPIYYPSDNLHIGHAYTTVAADTMARYKRMRGYDVMFLTGSDEHGQKIERKAKSEGMTPIQYVDGIVANFKHLWDKLLITNDDFIRTSEERHIKVVQHIFKAIYQRGDIYKSEYEGWYCTPCETFWMDRQLEEGKCPDCGREVELLKEESYFFRMSKYADQLLAYIDQHPGFIQPVSRRNEMVSFINQGLEDLCVSRTTFDWGIPVPIDSNHVIYVWFDALTNYISAIGYLDKPNKFNNYWPADIHLVGKDIVRFHTIIWPIILLAAGIPLPKQVFGHGWLLLSGGKMSKSKGNVVDPLVLIEKYGVDAVRYFLLREMPYGNDGSYSEDALIHRINMDLANDLGNLLSRTTAMVDKFCGGLVPKPGTQLPEDQELIELAAVLPARVEALIEKMELANSLAVIWELVNKANKYIENTAPWSLAKDEAKADRLASVMYNLVEAIRIVTVLCSPFMPNLLDKIWQQLGVQGTEELQAWESSKQWGLFPSGTKVDRGEPIFPRIQVNEEEMGKDKDKPAPPLKEKKPQKKENQEEKKMIDISDFANVELRVAEVLAAEKVEKTDKLLKLRVSLGDEERTLVAGVAKHYQPEQLIGRKIVVVANLKPAKLRGITSQGMVLAASQDDELSLLTVSEDVPVGSKVK